MARTKMPFIPGPTIKEGRRKGRPSGYTDDICQQYYRLCLLGMPDDKIANFFGVSIETMVYWKQTQPEFSQAAKLGRELAAGKTVSKMFDRACGYEHPEEKIFYDAKLGSEIRVQTTKHYPPDTAAAIFLLKNWMPQYFRDKTEQDIHYPDGIPVMMNDNRAKQTREKMLAELTEEE